MRNRSGSLAVSGDITITLLLGAAMLVVVGAFDANLGWDIFSPHLEAILTAVFICCLALAAIGVAICLVISSHETVRNFTLIRGALGMQSSTDSPEKSPRAIVRWSMAGALGLVAIVVSCGVANYLVQIHRYQVFKRLAAEQFAVFEPILRSEVSLLSEPPTSRVSPTVHDVIKTLDAFPFVRRSTFYLPDAREPRAMWGYTAWRDYDESDGFARFFVAKAFEKAMLAATNGDPAPLEEQNATAEFVWYSVVTNSAGKPLGVIRIDGNPTENFRDY